MTVDLAILHLETPEQAEALYLRGAFTTMTRAGPKTWRLRQVALLLDLGQDDDEPAFTELGYLTRSHQRLATGWHRLRYSRQHEFEPLAVDELVDALPARLRRNLADRVSSEGAIPQATAESVVTAFSRLRPGSGRALNRLLGQGPRQTPRLRGESLQAAAHEADAVRLALDIARIPRRALREARPDGELSFVERLAELRAPEDTAIAYDSMRFLDFDRIDSPTGVVRFRSGHEQLTVINVNKQPLERTTGADLIYVNESIGAFVLVQYKTFRREGSPSRLVYRPDAQLAEELERMRRIQVADDDGTPEAYRLHAGCCFLKFCKPITSLDYPPRELVSGMYLPLDYYDALVRSDHVRGPRGGTVLSYETVERFIPNHLFVGLVRGAWAGSRGETSEKLTDIVLAGLSADRSITVATQTQGSEFSRQDA